MLFSPVCTSFVRFGFCSPLHLQFAFGACGQISWWWRRRWPSAPATAATSTWPGGSGLCLVSHSGTPVTNKSTKTNSSKPKLTIINAAAKHDICAWTEGNDFMASETESGSSSTPWHREMLISMFLSDLDYKRYFLFTSHPPCAEQLIFPQFGIQVSIKWGLSRAVIVLSAMFMAILNVRETQNLRNTWPIVTRALVATATAPLWGTWNTSTVNT